MDDDKILQLKKIVDESSRIVFFGGAGVSTESGIPDFRSTSGLYNQIWKYPPEEIVSHSFFENKPSEFYKFYCSKMIDLTAQPNPAHKKLVEWEKQGKLLAIVTQNIDGLHQKAGSKKVLELHGSVHRNYCVNCHSFFDANFVLEQHKTQKDGIPRCPNCKHIVKPDVVLYEEGLDNDILDESLHAISTADTLIIGGTSLSVYPAASLVRYFRGENLVIINMSPTQYDHNSTLLIEEKIGEVFSKL